MTTNPKAKRFRIRTTGPVGAMPEGWDPEKEIGPATRSTAAAPPSAEPAPAAAPETASTPPEAAVVAYEPDELTLPRRAKRDARAQEDTPPPAPISADPAKEAEAPAGSPPQAAPHSYSADNLSSRQLRVLRRVAQKNGVEAETDQESLRILLARGIDPFDKDPFERSFLPDIKARSGKEGEEDEPHLPEALRGKTRNPSQFSPPPASSSERRQKEIMSMQRDIARRRRRKTLQLLTRLSFFVFLPTLLAGYYYYFVATPMYSTKSEFLILQADGAGTSVSSLFSGTQFATNQDSIAVQSYLQSKDAMLRLDADVGFEEHFTQDWIDPIQRLQDDASIEQVYKTYKRYVKIGYDPSEGVLRMETMAADPALAALFSTQLIQYAEERVDDLSRRKREDAMQAARVSLERAKADRRAAQHRLVELQEGTIVDPDAVIASLRTQISNYELQLQDKKLELSSLNANARPNQARVDGVEGEIARLEQVVEDLTTRMTQAQADDNSLAAKTAEVRMAQADLATTDLFLQAALENQKQAEMEANRQVRYLTTSVRPVAPEDPSYPRAFENTILVLFIMSGVYLMISLTSAILKEQVSN